MYIKNVTNTDGDMLLLVVTSVPIFSQMIPKIFIIR